MHNLRSVAIAAKYRPLATPLSGVASHSRFQSFAQWRAQHVEGSTSRASSREEIEGAPSLLTDPGFNEIRREYERFARMNHSAYGWLVQ
jgi:hypothetical protein